MEPISQNQDNNFFTLEALVEDYINEEKKNHRATTVRNLELRLYRFLVCFKQKPIHRDSETWFWLVNTRYRKTKCAELVAQLTFDLT